MAAPARPLLCVLLQCLQGWGPLLLVSCFPGTAVPLSLLRCTPGSGFPEGPGLGLALMCPQVPVSHRPACPTSVQGPQPLWDCHSFHSRLTRSSLVPVQPWRAAREAAAHLGSCSPSRAPGPGGDPRPALGLSPSCSTQGLRVCSSHGQVR